MGYSHPQKNYPLKNLTHEILSPLKFVRLRYTIFFLCFCSPEVICWPLPPLKLDLDCWNRLAFKCANFYALGGTLCCTLYFECTLYYECTCVCVCVSTLFIVIFLLEALFALYAVSTHALCVSVCHVTNAKCWFFIADKFSVHYLLLARIQQDSLKAHVNFVKCMGVCS